jgi:NADP-dependent aldehyde dehydrogenase
MVFLPTGPDAELFTAALRQSVEGSASFHLLTKAIQTSYGSAIASRKTAGVAKPIAEGVHSRIETGFTATPVVFQTDAPSFLGSDLGTEIFGPTTLLVHYSNRKQILAIACALEGQLTATIHGTEEDMPDFADLIGILENKVGRLVFNGFPTGVEVTHAIVHGGSYPATSGGRSTSVGTQAIFRFTRPVCYQDFPEYVLPDELKGANPLGIWRLVDGEMIRTANTHYVSK